MVEKRPLTADVRVRIPLWAALIPAAKRVYADERLADLKARFINLFFLQFGRVRRGGKPKLPNLKASSRDRAEVACLAHNQEVGGPNPSRARDT